MSECDFLATYLWFTFFKNYAMGNLMLFNCGEKTLTMRNYVKTAFAAVQY